MKKVNRQISNQLKAGFHIIEALVIIAVIGIIAAIAIPNMSYSKKIPVQAQAAANTDSVQLGTATSTGFDPNTAVVPPTTLAKELVTAYSEGITARAYETVQSKNLDDVIATVLAHAEKCKASPALIDAIKNKVFDTKIAGHFIVIRDGVPTLKTDSTTEATKV